jgi:hypothetical protein
VLNLGDLAACSLRLGRRGTNINSEDNDLNAGAFKISRRNFLKENNFVVIPDIASPSLF